MSHVKPTYEWIKCTTRKRTLFYLLVFFVLSFVAYRIESSYFSAWFSSVPELVRMLSSLVLALLITVWLYLIQLDSIQLELTATIRSLLSQLHKVQPESPWTHIAVEGLHCDDELHEVISVLNTKSSQIQHHIDYLKKLIWYIQHEFKTPLWIIQLHAERIKNISKDEISIESVASIEAEVVHLSSLVESIISLLSAQNTEIQDNETLLDIGELTRQIWGELMHIHENAQITYVGEEHIQTHSYIPFAKAILRNLIDNALTHWSDQVTITFDIDSVQVSDVWSWIPDEYAEKIWLPFWRKSSTKETSEWVWLGLSLVKELVQKLWWKIAASNNTSWWTTFTLYFS